MRSEKKMMVTAISPWFRVEDIKWGEIDQDIDEKTNS